MNLSYKKPERCLTSIINELKKGIGDQIPRKWSKNVVGMRGFEPPISRPPDAHFNRTKLHPEKQISKALFCFIFAKIKFHSFPTMIKHIFSLFLLCLTINSYGQNKYTLSGYVKDNETGEYLIGASVFLEDMRKGTSTNQYGFYSITVEEGNYSIAFSFLGLKTEKKKHTTNKKY